MLSPNLQDLSGLFLSVGRGCNDEQTVKHVYGNTMRTLVIGASDTVKMKQQWMSRNAHQLMEVDALIHN